MNQMLEQAKELFPQAKQAAAGVIPQAKEMAKGLIPHKEKNVFLSQNVGTAERVVSGLVGAWLLSRAFRANSAIGKTAAFVPAAMALKRAFTGKCELYGAAGLSSAGAPKKENNSLGRKPAFEPAYVNSGDSLRAPISDIAGSTGGTSLAQ